MTYIIIIRLLISTTYSVAGYCFVKRKFPTAQRIVHEYFCFGVTDKIFILVSQLSPRRRSVRSRPRLAMF